ncbi:pyrroline-5-carboxylate reductase [Demetria terragena]|uniref:pyrroline-5-carboxylate reductase n=1 Tax=Demetria terragena TaxID=63959 RepID=UPI00037F8E28|nr:pyrroline-5-carboxylate reductase [Demetria terragena]
MNQPADHTQISQDETVAFIGAGAMGEAILSGLLRSGYRSEQLIISDPSADRVTHLIEKFGVRGLATTEAVAAADTVVLAVKPKDMATVLAEIGGSLKADALVISIAAGLTTSSLEGGLPEGVAVVRVMPNTPSLVGEGMAALSGGTHCTPQQVEAAAELMRACGQAVVVPESSQNAVTAVSGSGPAYVFAVIESMIDGAVLLGLPRDIARELVVQTVFGAATLVKESGDSATVLRERVSSPGGTTVAALRELDERAVRAAFQAAMEAAALRSAELSGE